jgi:hypothetical protein
MKTKKYILRSLSTCLIAASLSACVDLEPRAMSFLTPENTFVDKAGLETLSTPETVKLILYMNMLGLTWLLWVVLKPRKSIIWLLS